MYENGSKIGLFSRNYPRANALKLGVCMVSNWFLIGNGLPVTGLLMGLIVTILFGAHCDQCAMR